MKAQGRERDDLKLELARLPVGSNVVLHPTAIKHLADRLRRPTTHFLHSQRARLALVIDDLHETGELQPIIRELIRSIVVDRDPDNRLVIRVEANLEPFLKEDSQTKGAVKVVEGEKPSSNVLQ